MNQRAAIYLDYAATTPVDAMVAACMAECLMAGGVFGNPASGHDYGRAARERVAAARQQVAALIGARAADVYFTSGATEADNLAILGLVRGMRTGRGRGAAPAPAAPHLITARTEHKAVLDPCHQLEREGCAITYLSPDASGRISPGQLQAALRPETVLVSLMHANNETGVINDIAAFGALCRAHGAALHVDAAQSAGKLPIDVTTMGVDLLSFTAHKLYGPKGIGALYASAARRVCLQPLMYGGGQERGVRSGTLAVHQIVGFGAACELAGATMAAETARLAKLRARLWEGIADLPGVRLNSPVEVSLAGLLNVSFTGIEGESLLAGLPELALASGSACNSDSDEPSYVLRALGHDRESAQSSLRFSLGRGTSDAQIEVTISSVRREVLRLQALTGSIEQASAVRAERPAGAGGAEEGASGEAGARAQGTWVRFMLNISGQQIAQARYQAYGCPQTLAACEWLTSRLCGRPWHDPGLGGPLDWAEALALAPDRLTRLLVVEDALQAALTAAQRDAGGGGTMSAHGT